jgi:aspartate/methionine/tyrosine aminotransferase
MAELRSTVSCSSTVGQSLLKNLYATGAAVQAEKKAFRNIIQARYKKVRALVDARKGHPALRAMPFNSGYFMSFRCASGDAESLRQKLLCRYGIGTIAIDEHTLRIAFSSLEDECIETVYTAIYQAAEELQKSN